MISERLCKQSWQYRSRRGGEVKLVTRVPESVLAVECEDNMSRPPESFCFSLFHDGSPLVGFASAAGPFQAIGSES